MNYLTNDTELTAVANAIREKCETTDSLEWPNGFIQAIEDCETGGPELKWLWGNQITNTLSGTIDSTDDAYAGPILNFGVYGVSTQDGTPTPEAPVAIKSVDAPVLTMAGKNLIANSGTSYSLTGSQYATYVLASGIDPDAATALTFLLQATVPSSQRLMLYTSAGDRISTGESQAYFADNAFVVQQAANIKKILDAGSIRIYSTPYTSGSSVVTKIDTCQLELGSTTTTYEPYQGTTVPLLPEGMSLRSLPDGTHDQLNLTYLRPSTREGWAWYSRELVQRVVKIELNGMEANDSIFVESDFATNTSQLVTISKSLFPDGIGFASNQYNIVSNRFVQTGRTSTLNGVVDSGVAFTTVRNTPIMLRLPYPELDSVEAVEQWFEENPVVVCLNDFRELDSRTTQLDPIELPIMPSENATVWCDGGSAQPTFMLEYIQDANIVISRLEDSIADLVTS